jgi:hypothetical protein
LATSTIAVTCQAGIPHPLLLSCLIFLG